MIERVLFAVSLALDAFAVSVSSGISVPGFGPRQAVKMGGWFGAFQFLMPLAGWLLGSSVSTYIEAVATSIDALAVGVSMALMSVNILTSAFIIGIGAFCLSVVGGLVGRRLGCLFQRRAELVGGLVLVASGLKILMEHLAEG